MWINSRRVPIFLTEIWCFKNMHNFWNLIFKAIFATVYQMKFKSIEFFINVTKKTVKSCTWTYIFRPLASFTNFLRGFKNGNLFDEFPYSPKLSWCFNRYLTMYWELDQNIPGKLVSDHIRYISKFSWKSEMVERGPLDQLTWNDPYLSIQVLFYPSWPSKNVKLFQ